MNTYISEYMLNKSYPIPTNIKTFIYKAVHIISLLLLDEKLIGLLLQNEELEKLKYTQIPTKIIIVIIKIKAKN